MAFFFFFLIDAEEAVHFIHWCTQRAAAVDYQSDKRYQYSITVTSSEAAHPFVRLYRLARASPLRGRRRGGKKADSQDQSGS